MSKVTVEHFLGESFLGSEMIREGALWCTGSGADIADASSLVTGLKHYLQPGINHIFAKRGSTHNEVSIRMYVFVGQELFLDNPESKQRNLDALRESRIAPPMEYR